ncbi:isoprenylcysteine carboxylmethyltransferase family protein [Rhizobium leguminosarum]|uniref:methyltransferase family protein n=1 Tax=Rhizobium leguminosarum TaxID=384 RepID=UPI003F995510
MESRIDFNLSRIQRIRRFVVIVQIIVVLMLLLLFKPSYDSNTVYHVALEITGFVLIIVGIGIRLWSTLYVGGRKSRELIADGPYSVTRNPLYVGSIIAALGVGLQTGMLTFGLLSMSLCSLTFYIVIRKEESFLRNAFGPAYEAYCASTPRLMPSFALYRHRSSRYEFEPAALWRTLRDGLVFFLAIPLTELIERLHREDNLPFLLSFV